MARKAKNPAAAVLFHEYMLTEAQTLMVGLDYVPTNTSVPSPLKGVRIMITDPIRSLVDGATHGYPARAVDGVQAGVEAAAMIAWLR